VAVALIALAVSVTAAFAAGTAVSVKPRRGGASTTFTISFRAPDATGVNGALERYYLVQGSTRTRARCTSEFSLRAPASAGAPGSAAGTVLHVRVRPGTGAGHWCTGLFHGRIDEFAGPVCEKGKLCPLFLVVIRQIGAFSFRVVPAARH
jgi:hypothetical protein